MATDPRERLPNLEEFTEMIGNAIRQERIRRGEHLTPREGEILRNLELLSLWEDPGLPGQLQQASELDKVLPRDLRKLVALLDDRSLDITLRAKVLEVMIYRGAVNEASYEALASPERFYTENEARVDGVDLLMQFYERKDEFAERRRYQEAARDAIMLSPDGATLFNQLSKSPDQLPQGRSGATEFMNMMLRNGGMYGTDKSRHEFESDMLQLPAETRGRMMYHLLDAGQSSDIHLKGEQRTTGTSFDVSFDTGNGGLGLGFSKSWDYLPDNHWKEAGKDITRQMNHDLQGRPEEFLNKHKKGLQDAAALDKGPAPD